MDSRLNPSFKLSIWNLLIKLKSELNNKAHLFQTDKFSSHSPAQSGLVLSDLSPSALLCSTSTLPQSSTLMESLTKTTWSQPLISLSPDTESMSSEPTSSALTHSKLQLLNPSPSTLPSARSSHLSLVPLTEMRSTLYLSAI